MASRDGLRAWRRASSTSSDAALDHVCEEGVKHHIIVLFAALSCSAGSVCLERVGELNLPQTWRGHPIGGISGISHVSKDMYYAVRDNGSHGELFSLRIDIDRDSGIATNCEIVGVTRLNGREDLEDVAWDATSKNVIVCDEHDGSIRAFNPISGDETERIVVSVVFDAFVFNRSFEALSIRSNGLEMWTCNEEALNRRVASMRTKHKGVPIVPVATETPDVDDGPLSSRTNGSLVRLQKFTRTNKSSSWKPSGQWAYMTDTVSGKPFFDKSRNGVSAMLCLDNGSLLVLEREMSVKKGDVLPTFRCRIYSVDFEGSTDTSNSLSLTETSVRSVKKTRVFGARTGYAMYEGMCLGPELNDGSQSVILISDGDDGAVSRIMTLKMRIAHTKDF